MKITTFNPQIITTKANDIITVFEDLGFTRSHRKTGIGERNVDAVVMEDANGFKMDISQVSELPREAITAIRMNVDDFDEAYKILESHGFRNIYGDRTADTGSSRSAVLFSSSGIAINLIQHIK